MNTPTSRSTDDNTRYSWLVHWPVQRKMLLAFGLLLLVIIGNGAAFLFVLSEQRGVRESTISTYKVLSTLEQVQLHILNQQTGLRGYQIAGQDQFLAPYFLGKEELGKHLALLRDVTRDNAIQQPRLDRIGELLNRWQAEVAEPQLALVRTQGQMPPESLTVLIAKDKRIIDPIKDVILQMQDTERQLLAQRSERLEQIVRFERWFTAITMVFGIAVVIASLMLVRALVARPLANLTALMTRLSDDDHTIVVPGGGRRDEIGALARALLVFKQMVIDIQQRNWVKTHAGQVAGALQASADCRTFAEVLTSRLTPLLEAGVAAFYFMDESTQQLELIGSYGYQQAKHGQTRYALGQGLTGQCALERKTIVLDSIPEDYVRIHSGTGEAVPATIILLPLQTQDRLLGVIEFGSFGRFSPRQLALLEELLPITALSLENLLRALRTKQLLKESQILGEELQASTEELRVQQEELRTTNESLHAKSQQLQEQAAQLRASEEELRVQSEELQVSNEELRQKGSILAEQKLSLEALQKETQEKADELARASQYKSEFLANMSHELRTPLNSLLILSRGLAENEEGHLDADEVESATVIHESGSNLLRLINDILDLSKVESGKMELELEDMSLTGFAASLTRSFRHMARERSLDFVVTLEPGLPTSIETDSGKLEQIVNNLISNALKFTRQGSVQVHIARAVPTNGREGDIAINVVDTGIGIPKDKYEKIFQAFEQVDGSTSRHFGGTGLGLSIARGMAQLLGGDIRLNSIEGMGTTFTLLLPEKHGLPRAPLPAGQVLPSPVPAMPAPVERASSSRPTRPPMPVLDIPDDRALLKAGDTVILIVEDDPAFARILVDLVRRKGYRALFAGDGESGLILATQCRPTGILLDVMLPGMDGFSVIEQLKATPATRHIPVHFISATEDQGRGLDLGAVGFLTKPVTREALGGAFEKLLHFAEGSTRQVLVVDDDSASRLAVRKLIGGSQVQISEAANGRDALAALGQQTFDCVVLDLGMPDMNGFEFLERAAAAGPVPPVVVYSGRDLSPEETLKLRQYTDSIVIKGARSPERLLDEVSLFLHSIREAPAPSRREVDGTLSGRTVLVVDDDMRNIFALSKALRAKGLAVVMAQDGPKAIKQIEENRSIELVLMDIMMPGMDGYQTMGEIRKSPANAKLPIIAVTAKAMRGDREKCLEAGANDYLAKPIDLDQLFSMLRVWLPPR